MVNVKKWDGSLVPFDKDRVFRTCLRMRLSKHEAREVAEEISKKVRDGMDTREVMQMILQHGKRHKKFMGHITDLRDALGDMRSKPEFEQFVALLMENEGYKTVTNKIIQGRCIDHEIDVVGVRGNEVICVEVKHHRDLHTFTGLDTILELNSVFEDLLQGYAAKKHNYNFTKVILVTNTKMSHHAMKYAECRGIDLLGWNTPEHAGIEHYVHSKLFYPINILKDVDKSILEALGENGIITLKQLFEANQRELSKATGIDHQTLRELVNKADDVLQS